MVGSGRTQSAALSWQSLAESGRLARALDKESAAVPHLRKLRLTLVLGTVRRSPPANEQRGKTRAQSHAWSAPYSSAKEKSHVALKQKQSCKCLGQGSSSVTQLRPRDASREPPSNDDFDRSLLSPHVRSALAAARRSVSQTTSPPLVGTHRCCNNDPNNLPEVNKTRCVAIAVMVFGVISCLGFLVPGLWWGGLGGILAVVGSSVVLCCSG